MWLKIAQNVAKKFRQKYVRRTVSMSEQLQVACCSQHESMQIVPDVFSASRNNVFSL